MPVGPRPHSSTPLTYKKSGITVMGPANNINRLSDKLVELKSFKLLVAIN